MVTEKSRGSISDRKIKRKFFMNKQKYLKRLKRLKDYKIINVKEI